MADRDGPATTEGDVDQSGADWPVTVVARWSDAGRFLMDDRFLQIGLASMVWIGASAVLLDHGAGVGKALSAAILFGVLFAWRKLRRRRSETYELRLDDRRLWLRTGEHTPVTVSLDRDRAGALFAAQIGLDWTWKAIVIDSASAELARLNAGPATVSVGPPGDDATAWARRNNVVLDRDGTSVRPVLVTALLGTWWPAEERRFSMQGSFGAKQPWKEPDLIDERLWRTKRLRRNTGLVLALLVGGLALGLFSFGFRPADVFGAYIPFVLGAIAAAWILVRSYRG